MGFFSSIAKVFTSPFSGGSSGGSTATNTTTSKTEVNPITNVNIDLVPLGDILSDSQKSSAELVARSNILVSKNNKEAQTISLINSELDRQVKLKNAQNIDTYLEHAKNGLVLSAIVVVLIYVTKKPKKRR